jgi:signal peptidase I
MQSTQRIKGLIIGLFSVAVFAAPTAYQPVRVIGESMAPTLKSGQWICLERGYYRRHRPARGEVVVFRRSGVTYVKRIYRTPGETVHYVGSGTEQVAPIRPADVLLMAKRYRHHPALRPHSVRVPEDHVFVIGDNVCRSEDSRDFGSIPIASIIGRAVVDVDQTKGLGAELDPPSPRTALGQTSGSTHRL